MSRHGDREDPPQCYMNIKSMKRKVGRRVEE
jgi:hypothetical protein